MQAANAMVNLGFKNAGYQYVILDDCWAQRQRDPTTNRILPDFNKFPDGMNGVANKIHALGLKYGMYSSAGTMTCGQYPGSLGYEMIDAKTFADWGVDYLKVSIIQLNIYVAHAQIVESMTTASLLPSGSTIVLHATVTPASTGSVKSTAAAQLQPPLLATTPGTTRAPSVLTSSPSMG